MKRSQRVIQLRSYALAFAVVLSPAFLQFYSCDRGDTYLLSLKALVDWQDQVQAFNANNRSYAATIYSHTLTLEVVTRKADSRATVQWIIDGTPGQGQDIGLGGGASFSRCRVGRFNCTSECERSRAPWTDTPWTSRPARMAARAPSKGRPACASIARAGLPSA